MRSNAVQVRGRQPPGSTPTTASTLKLEEPFWGRGRGWWVYYSGWSSTTPVGALLLRLELYYSGSMSTTPVRALLRHLGVC